MDHLLLSMALLRSCNAWAKKGQMALAAKRGSRQAGDTGSAPEVVPGGSVMTVEEILRNGHSDLGPGQLEYVRDMANRVGFVVLEALPHLGPDVVQICLRISMRNPMFVARVRSCPAPGRGDFSVA